MSALYDKLLREAAAARKGAPGALRNRARHSNDGLPSRAPDRVSNVPVRPAADPPAK